MTVTTTGIIEQLWPDYCIDSLIIIKLFMNLINKINKLLFSIFKTRRFYDIKATYQHPRDT